MIFIIIKIGTTSDDKKVLNKNFSGEDVNVQLKKPTDLLNPVFIITYNSAYLTANYLYCTDFKRYYYITNIQVMTGHQMQLSCSVDVLMSYNAEIKNVKALIVRQEQAGLSLMTDTSIMVKNYAIIDTYNFPSQFDVAFGSYVMQVIGGI